MLPGVTVAVVEGKIASSVDGDGVVVHGAGGGTTVGAGAGA